MRRFLTQHPTLSKRYIIYQKRVCKAAAVDIEIQHEFYQDLSNLAERKLVTPDNIWNCNEKGITMGRGGHHEKAIVYAGTRTTMALTESSREFVSILETISTAGRVISPFIVYQRKTHRRVLYYTNSLDLQVVQVQIVRQTAGQTKRREAELPSIPSKLGWKGISHAAMLIIST